MSRRVKFTTHIAVAMLGIGAWQLVQGAYIPGKAWLAQELMLRAWQRAAVGVEKPAPWPWADTWPVARLRTQDGATDLIVLAGGSGRTLAFGPGHLSASALPGTRGNSVIAGHRDTHFRFLESISNGDVLIVETPDAGKHRYEVVAREIVDSRNTQISLDTDKTVLTLITCYPFATQEVGGPLRYVITANSQLPEISP